MELFTKANGVRTTWGVAALTCKHTTTPASMPCSMRSPSPLSFCSTTQHARMQQVGRGRSHVGHCETCDGYGRAWQGKAALLVVRASCCNCLGAQCSNACVCQPQLLRYCATRWFGYGPVLLLFSQSLGRATSSRINTLACCRAARSRNAPANGINAPTSLSVSPASAHKACSRGTGNKSSTDSGCSIVLRPVWLEIRVSDVAVPVPGSPVRGKLQSHRPSPACHETAAVCVATGHSRCSAATIQLALSVGLL
ncbi:hypothetical protein COO60DRAFT_1517652 [Scenedesmus sp. NREL 46B-D3]|nr:hypothetical protein COO60DRAFT_1517652 [Scenedesmus sp. NREL 46B-D3]